MLPAHPRIPRSTAAERPARPASRSRAPGAAARGLAGLVRGAGGYLGGNALPPPAKTFYFPTGIVVSPGRTALYVVSSDFDLAYDGGTLLTVDLSTLRPRLSNLLSHLQCTTAEAAQTAACQKLDPGHQVDSVEKACAQAFLGRNAESLLYPGPCAAFPLSNPDDPADLAGVVTHRAARVVGAFTLGAFSSGAALVDLRDKKTDDLINSRLFVPVRGDPSLTFFDVKNDTAPSQNCAGKEPGKEPEDACFQADCGATGTENRCGDDHRIGIEADRYANSRALTLPVEPVGVAASEDGEAIVVAHQTQKAVSLSLNTADGKPTTVYALGNLADGPTEVVTVPIPRYIKGKLAEDGSTFGYQPGFLVSYRGAAQIDLFRYTDDAHAAPSRAFLTRAYQAAVTVNADGKDSRGLVLDAGARQACEASCASDDEACQIGCLDIPMRIFMANRAPATLLIGKVQTKLVKNIPEGGGEAKAFSAYDTVSIDDAVPLAFGASKVALGNVITREGKQALRVFIAAFDSRLVFSYDPEARRIEAVIRTGRGPHALALDTGDDSDPDGAGPLQGDGSGLHSYLYIGHFTDSYLGVVDLDMRHPDTFGTIFASIGTPTPPRESK
ncbi:MAG: hypothetical protein U0359_15160 [Byssovorax sp.]